MMKKSKYPTPATLLFALSGLAAPLLFSPSAHAAAETWVGNTSADLAGTNWTPNATTTSGDSWTFDVAGSSGTTLTDSLGAFTLAGLNYTANAPAYTIGTATSGAITLTGDITNGISVPQILNTPLTIGTARTFTGNLTLGGEISGTAGAVTLAGTGTVVTYNGATTNAFVGGTIVSAGTTLILGKTTSSNTVHAISGSTTINGTLQIAPTVAGGSSGSAQFSGGTGNTVTINTGGTLDLNGTSQVIAGVAGTGATTTAKITNTGTAAGILTVGETTVNDSYAGTIISSTGGLGLTKVRANTQTLTGANTYTGATLVQGGQLLVNGTHIVPAGTTTAMYTTAFATGGSPAPTSAVLGGAGTINVGASAISIGNGTVAGNITGGGLGTVGMLTLATTNATGVFFNGGSATALATYNVDITTAAGTDKLAITGLLNLSGAFDQITLNNISALGNGTYQLATYTSITGTFDTVTGLASNETLVYNTNGTELDLVVGAVPEPSTWMVELAGLSVVGAVFGKRRGCARQPVVATTPA